MSIIDNLALMMVPIIVVVLAVYSIGGIGLLIHWSIERYKHRQVKGLDNTICPICGKGILLKRVLEEAFTYEDEVLEVPNYIVYECMYCGEAIVDQDTLEKSGEILREWMDEIDNGKER